MKWEREGGTGSGKVRETGLELKMPVAQQHSALLQAKWHRRQLQTLNSNEKCLNTLYFMFKKYK